jgi:hypothetical protein
VFAAVQCAGCDGIGQALEHSAARTGRAKHDGGCGGWLRWRYRPLNNAIPILNAPHRLFDPLDDSLDA